MQRRHCVSKIFLLCLSDVHCALMSPTRPFPLKPKFAHVGVCMYVCMYERDHNNNNTLTRAYQRPGLSLQRYLYKDINIEITLLQKHSGA